MPESPMPDVKSDSKLPLSRITVLDLTLARAGPTCVRHLADWGANVIRSEPPGAVVEWMNRDGMWVVVGSTPTKEIVIEATGKPELFRVSREGYLPQTQWVASTGSSRNIDILFELQQDLPYGSR